MSHAATARWNLRKSYLHELSARGIRIVPTLAGRGTDAAGPARWRRGCALPGRGSRLRLFGGLSQLVLDADAPLRLGRLVFRIVVAGADRRRQRRHLDPLAIAVAFDAGRSVGPAAAFAALKEQMASETPPEETKA